MPVLHTRRTMLATGGAMLATSLVPARAASLKPTRSMRGGSNNYRPGAPIVDRIGGGGFMMSGTVRRAGKRRAAFGHPHPDLGPYDRRA